MREALTKQEIIFNIHIMNAKEDKERILKILNETDVSILKYLRSVTVHDSKYNPPSVTDSNCAWGTTLSYILNGKLLYSEIHLISSKFYTEYPPFKTYEEHFEHTLKHELGHIRGYMISYAHGDSERFANTYAKNPESVNNFKFSFLDDVLKFILTVLK